MIDYFFGNGFDMGRRRATTTANNIQDNKALKTFLVVAITLLACYTPNLLRRVIELYTDGSPDWPVFVVTWLYISNSAFNVFIYCLFNQAYRQMAKKIISERLPRCKRPAVGPVNI